MKISGECCYFDKTGRRHKVEGFGNFSDDMALRTIKVSGELSFGIISCDEIKVSGECFGDSLTAQKLFIEGTLKIDSVKVEETFNLQGSLKVNNIETKETVIESRSGLIGTIKCQQLKIFHNDDFADSHNSCVRIKSIEADEVNLENCSVNVIRCKDAFIGANCTIKKLFVAGEYKVAADSKVAKIIRT